MCDGTSAMSSSSGPAFTALGMKIQQRKCKILKLKAQNAHGAPHTTQAAAAAITARPRGAAGLGPAALSHPRRAQLDSGEQRGDPTRASAHGHSGRVLIRRIISRRRPRLWSSTNQLISKQTCIESPKRRPHPSSQTERSA